MQAFDTRQKDLSALLAALKRNPICRSPEIETHTWDVLPAEYGTTDVRTADRPGAVMGAHAARGVKCPARSGAPICSCRRSVASKGKPSRHLDLSGRFGGKDMAEGRRLVRVMLGQVKIRAVEQIERLQLDR
jgi:hypothetical protein